MKKSIVLILTVILLTPLLAKEMSENSDYNIEVKGAWDLLGALKDIKDMSIFNRDCVNQVWIYSDDRGWANYNKSNNYSGFLPIDEIKAGRGFWIKGKEECSIEVNSVSDTNVSTSVDIYTRDNLKIFMDKEEFYIKLESNPTTGFSWKPDYNSSIFFEPISNYESSSNLIGAGGFETWHFKVKDINLPENTTIKMNYAQHWEGGGVGESLTFQINFTKSSYDIAFGETINIDNGKLIVKFEDITDSRCAKGVQCIVAGDVDLKLGITGLLEIYEMQSFKLNETKSNAQSYSITLSSVTPYPSINEDINNSEYIATINIIKPNK